jgi:hypothetical protein
MSTNQFDTKHKLSFTVSVLKMWRNIDCARSSVDKLHGTHSALAFLEASRREAMESPSKLPSVSIVYESRQSISYCECQAASSYLCHTCHTNVLMMDRLSRTCTAIRVFVSRSSFIGPRRMRRKLSIVRFVDSRMTPDWLCVVNSVRPSAERRCRIVAVSLAGGFKNSVFDG